MKIARAFLSHSSSDKPLVQRVAQLLGRHRAIYDGWNFEAGDSLIKAMREQVQSSDLFVLFASRQALESKWVRYEEKLAEELSITRNQDNVLVLLTDGSVEIDEVAAWLKRFNIARVRNPNEAAFLINRQTYRLEVQHGREQFIGRSQEYSALESMLIDSRNKGRVFCISGYRGVGRESLASAAAERFFRLQGKVTIELHADEVLADLVSKLAEDAALYASGEELVAIVQNILANDNESNTAVLSDYIARLGETNRLLVIRDEGGLLNADGELGAAVRTVLSVAEQHPNACVALIARRSLKGNRPQVIPSIRLTEMSDADMRKLLSYLLTDVHTTIPDKEFTEVLEFVRGYPPAAYIAVGLARDYGASYLIKDKRQLADFQATSFMQDLRRDGMLDGSRAVILSTLLAYSPLPFAVLESVVRHNGAMDISSDLLDLQDYGLVVVDPNQYYKLSRPLVESISRSIGFRDVDHLLVAQKLVDYVHSSEGAEPSVELYRCLYRAMTFSGTQETSPFAIGLLTDIEAVQERLYHQRKYENSIELGLLVLERSPKSFNGQRYLARAYAQVGNYPAALSVIDGLPGRYAMEKAYLRSFVMRKDGKLTKSLEYIQEARNLGKDDVAVYRDMAFVKFQLGDLEGAAKALVKAEERDPTNRFVVDFKVQIALQQGDFAEVDRLMVDLQRIDEPEHFLHRESDVAYAKGDYLLAYRKAKESVQIANPPMYFISQLVKSEIELRRFSEADDAIGRLDQDFPHLHHDIKLGLRIKLLIKQGKNRAALNLWNRLGDKSLAVHRALRRNALLGLIATYGRCKSRAKAARTGSDRNQNFTLSSTLGVVVVPSSVRILPVRTGRRMTRPSRGLPRDPCATRQPPRRPSPRGSAARRVKHRDRRVAVDLRLGRDFPPQAAPAQDELPQPHRAHRPCAGLGKRGT